MTDPSALTLAFLAVVLGVPLLALACLLVALGLGADFLILRGGGGRVLILGRVPRARHAEVREFFRRDLSAAGPLMVLGSRAAGRALRLRILGRLDPGRRQRVRNFLTECLR